jgi:hypothetical protein
MAISVFQGLLMKGDKFSKTCPYVFAIVLNKDLVTVRKYKLYADESCCMASILVVVS